MRVTGGQLAGRRLRGPPARGVRPTSDRVREALFASLGSLEEVGVLDLYAGTGALGIEALSRGAARAVFVERSAPALGVLRANLKSLGLQGVARVVRGEVDTVVRRLGRAGERFDLVLLDPPYGSGVIPGSLEALVGAGILAVGATVVVEGARREELAAIEGLAVVDERHYGDTTITRLSRGDMERRRGDP